VRLGQSARRGDLTADEVRAFAVTRCALQGLGIFVSLIISDDGDREDAKFIIASGCGSWACMSTTA